MPWDLFYEHFVRPGLPVEIPLRGTPEVRIFVTQGGASIGLRAPKAGNSARAPKLRMMQVKTTDQAVTVTSEERSAFQAFYAFLLDVADRIQVDNQPSLVAVQDAIKVWRRFLAELTQLSRDEQLGLWGELWTFRRLIAERGPEIAWSWVGPNADAHDFRLDNAELEVKTTTGERRLHRISRLDQLQPSPGSELFLISLQVSSAGAGSGSSLNDHVNAIRESLASSPECLLEFGRRLDEFGWSEDTYDSESDRYRLRSPARLVAVDDDLPRLTRELVHDALGSSSSRLDEVSYRLDVEGLGFEDGSAEFAAVFSP